MPRLPIPHLVAAAAALLAVASPSLPRGSSPRASVADAPPPPAASAPDAPPPLAARQGTGAASPQAAALLVQFVAAWKDERADALRPLLAPGDIRFRLDRPGQDDSAGAGEAPVYSAAQVYYMLQNHFAAVRTLEARQERRLATAGPDQAHGVVEVEWAADASAAPAELRLYVGLRRLAEGWRVVEVRALP